MLTSVSKRRSDERTPIMLRSEYLSAVLAPSVGTFGIEWQTDPKPAAAHRARRLRKVTTALCLTGVEYAKLSANNGVETGPLPWGEWDEHPHIITHKGVEYARVYTVDNTVRTIYTVDGQVVSRDEFNKFLTPSAAASSRPNAGTLTIKLSNMRLVGEPAVALR